MKKIIILISIVMFTNACADKFAPHLFNELQSGELEIPGINDDNGNENSQDTPDEADDKTQEPPPEEQPIVYSEYYHHYNPQAWHNRGVAIIFCPGQLYERCYLNGDRMQLHGNQDKGRDVWTIRGETGITGEIFCEDESGEKTYFELREDDRMQWGACSGR